MRKITIAYDSWTPEQKAEWRKAFASYPNGKKATDKDLKPTGSPHAVQAVERLYYSCAVDDPRFKTAPLASLFAREELQGFIFSLFLPEPLTKRTKPLKYSSVTTYLGRLVSVAKSLGCTASFRWVERFIGNFDFAAAGLCEPPLLTTQDYSAIGRELMRLGQAQLEACDAAAKPDRIALRQALVRYRTGLMIVTLTLVGFRVGELLAFELKKTFFERSHNGRHGFKIPAHLVKNKKEASFDDIPTQIEAAYDYYFAKVRPRFKNAANLAAVWISWEGHKLAYRSFYTLFVGLIEEATGIRTHPHETRHADADTARALGLDVPNLLRQINDRAQHAYGFDNVIVCRPITSQFKL